MHLTQTPSNRIKWPSAIFEASSAQEPFEEVHVVTAKAAYVDKACELAGDQLLRGGSISEQDIARVAKQIISSQRLTVHESVTVNGDGMNIVINAENVEDDGIMYRALDMLADALDQLQGEEGTITFGDALSFSLAEVPWIITQ